MAVFTLPAPPGFCFEATVGSHGWLMLAPFSREEGVVRAVLPVKGVPRAVRLSPGVRVEVEGPASPELERRVRSILALDQDLTAFHRRVRRRRSLAWIAERGLGRIVRAGDLYEDLVKLILTINCTWRQTVAACRALVDRLGPEGSGGVRGFPPPEVLREADLRTFRLGYREPWVRQLARRAGEIRSWEGLPPAELRRRLLELPGVGPYVADHALLMLGHSARVPVDSWLRSRAEKRLFRRGRATPARIQRYYAVFGEWAGRVAWFDLNREELAGGVGG